MNLKHSIIFLIWCSACFAEFVYDDLKPSVTDTWDLGTSSLKWEDGHFNGTIDATDFTGDGSALTGIGSGTGGIINTGSTTIGADSDDNGSGVIVLQIGGVTMFEVTNAGNIEITNTITSGTWNGDAIDISTYTNLVAGTNITLAGDTLNVDDAFLVNDASDTMLGTLTSDGLTVTTGNALTFGVVQWDDGSDKIEGNILADNSVDDDALDFTSITLASFTADIATTDLTDTANIMYLAAFDTFAELQTQIADKTLVNQEDTATLASAWTFNAGLSGSLIGNVTGDLTGNADTAELLETTRTFSISGDTTAPGKTFNGGGNVNLVTSIASGVIIDSDVNASAAIDADKLTDGSTNAIVTLTQETNWDTHLSSDGSDHSFIDQSVISGASPTFDNASMSGNISVWTNDSGYLTSVGDEAVQDIVGGMVSGNVETLIDVTYDDSGGKLDFVVDEASIDHDALTNFLGSEHFIQASINQVGTIVSGVWNGTAIDHGSTSGRDDNDHTQYVNAVSDTATINMTLTGQTISADVIPPPSDHGSLTGLADDDHTQYLLADGSRPLAGDWSLGNFNLTEVGNITGTDIDISAGTGNFTTIGLGTFGNLIIGDDGWIGSTSETNVIQIEGTVRSSLVFSDRLMNFSQKIQGDILQGRILTDGTATLSGGVLNDLAGFGDGLDNSIIHTYFVVGTNPRIIFADNDISFDAVNVNFGGTLQVNSSIEIGNGQYIGSFGEPNAIQIDSSGNIVMSQNLQVTGDFTVGSTAFDVDSANKTVGIGQTATTTAGLVVSRVASGVVADQTGLFFSGAWTPGAANLDFQSAVFAATLTSSSGLDVDNFFGVKTNLITGGSFNADITNACSIFSEMTFETSGRNASTITNAHHIHILDAVITNTADITTLMAFFAEQQTTGDTNWQIYSEGGASYFGGTDGIYLGQTDGVEKISSPSDGTLGLFAGTTIEANTNLFKFGLGSAADVVTEWVTSGGTGTFHYDFTDQDFEFDHTVIITSGWLDVKNGGIFAADDSVIDANLDVSGNITLGEGEAGNLTLSFSSLSDTGTLTWDDGASQFVLLNDIVFQGDVDIESGDLDVSGTITQSLITQTFSGSKTLTDGVATDLFEVEVGVGEMVGGSFTYTIEVDNGTDLQCHNGAAAFVAVNKAETVSSDCDEVYNPAVTIKVVTLGTLTDAFDCVDTNGNPGKITMRCNANTNLGGTPVITLKYTITMHSENTITGL